MKNYREIVREKMMEKLEYPTDEEVQQLIEEWDIVDCKICGKQISMFDASLTTLDSQECFICKTHK